MFLSFFRKKVDNQRPTLETESIDSLEIKDTVYGNGFSLKIN